MVHAYDTWKYSYEMGTSPRKQEALAYGVQYLLSFGDRLSLMESANTESIERADRNWGIAWRSVNRVLQQDYQVGTGWFASVFKMTEQDIGEVTRKTGLSFRESWLRVDYEKMLYLRRIAPAEYELPGIPDLAACFQ